jgi:hypothetical protein
MCSRGRFATPAQSLSRIVARAEGYNTCAATAWALSIVPGPFSIAPSRTRINRISLLCRRRRVGKTVCATCDDAALRDGARGCAERRGVRRRVRRGAHVAREQAPRCRRGGGGGGGGRARDDPALAAARRAFDALARAPALVCGGSSWSSTFPVRYPHRGREGEAPRLVPGTPTSRAVLAPEASQERSNTRPTCSHLTGVAYQVVAAVRKVVQEAQQRSGEASLSGRWVGVLLLALAALAYVVRTGVLHAWGRRMMQRSFSSTW